MINNKVVVCVKENVKEYVFKTETQDFTCGDYDVLIKIDSCALSSIDYTLLERFCEPPEDDKCFPVGKEVTGIVKTVGAKVTRFTEDDPVAGIIPLDSAFSGCSSYCILKEHDIVKKPDAISNVDAAAGIGDGMKAYTCLYYQARLSSAETVAVAGASKGFGLMIIQLAQYIGAKIIAIGSTDEEIAFLNNIEPPVDKVIDLQNNNQDVAELLLEETGGLGVDCFIDDGVEMYGEEFRDSIGKEKRLIVSKYDIISSLAVGGRWISTERNLQIDPPDSNTLGLKCASIHYLFEHSWSLSRGAVGRYLHILNDIMNKMEEGIIRPMVHHTVLLDDCIETMSQVENSTVGKVVVKVV